MIVDTMTDLEVTKEILTDYKVLIQTSLFRISEEYNRERKKKKIAKTDTYAKAYEIRTNKKNPWILLFSKPPAESKYKDDPCICFLTYHYTPKGLRVFKIIPGGGLSVFNAHVFQRYVERMNLDINNPLERVKHFFIHNGFLHTQGLKKSNEIKIITRCRDGLLLGNVKNDGMWIVHKTFIAFSEIKPDQDEISNLLIEKLQKQIEGLLNEGDFDKEKYEYSADTLIGIISKKLLNNK